MDYHAFMELAVTIGSRLAAAGAETCRKKTKSIHFLPLKEAYDANRTIKWF